jgi:hypothetical protein
MFAVIKEDNKSSTVIGKCKTMKNAICIAENSAHEICKIYGNNMIDSRVIGGKYNDKYIKKDGYYIFCMRDRFGRIKYKVYKCERVKISGWVKTYKTFVHQLVAKISIAVSEPEVVDTRLARGVIAYADEKITLETLQRAAVEYLPNRIKTDFDSQELAQYVSEIFINSANWEDLQAKCEPKEDIIEDDTVISDN